MIWAKMQFSTATTTWLFVANTNASCAKFDNDVHKGESVTRALLQMSQRLISHRLFQRFLHPHAQNQKQKSQIIHSRHVVGILTNTHQTKPWFNRQLNGHKKQRKKAKKEPNSFVLFSDKDFKNWNYSRHFFGTPSPTCLTGLLRWRQNHHLPTSRVDL